MHLHLGFICWQVRVTNLQDASEHIGEVLKRVKKEHLQRAYKINEWYNITLFFSLCDTPYIFQFVVDPIF